MAGERFRPRPRQLLSKAAATFPTKPPKGSRTSTAMRYLMLAAVDRTVEAIVAAAAGVPVAAPTQDAAGVADVPAGAACADARGSPAGTSGGDARNTRA